MRCASLSVRSSVDAHGARRLGTDICGLSVFAADVVTIEVPLQRVIGKELKKAPPSVLEETCSIERLIINY